MALLESSVTQQSYPKSARIRHRSEFLSISQQGVKYAGRYFILLVGKEAEVGSRLGITVSRKVGCAVVRNRLKRMLREYFRLTRESWPSRAVVVIARSGAARLTFADLQQDLTTILRRVAAK